MATLQSILVKLGLDPDDFRGGLGRAQKSLAKFRGDLVENRRGIEDFGNALSSLGRSTAFASLISGAVGLSAALAPAAGSLLLLPGMATAGAAAFGTYKVALSGFGEAMKSLDDPKKFAEAVAELSPAARESATAIRDLTPAWEGLTHAVQDTTFAGLAGEIRTLGGTYIPVLQSGMVGISGEFNRGAKDIAAWLREAQTVRDVESMFASARTVVGNLVDTARPLAQVLSDVGAVGGEVFAGLTEGAGSAAQRFADFVREARNTGRLRGWIEGGLDVLRQLWQLVKNLTVALKGVFAAAQPSGQSLLETLIQLTAQFAAWVNSAEGQAQLAAMFDTLGQVLGHLVVILPMVAGGLGTLLGWISSLPAPVQSLITGFLAWSLVIGVLITRFAPLFSLLGTLGGRFLAAATTSGTATNKIVAALGRGIAASTTWVARMTVMAATTVARFVMMAAGAVAQATLMAVRVGVQFALMTAQAIARTVAAAAAVVAQWAIMAAGAMARAVIMAASWFVAMGPIGWVIAAVVGLVALIVANWDTVVAWTEQAWSAVSGWVASAWQWIVDSVSAAGRWIVDLVSSAWTSARDAVVSGVTSCVDFVRNLPDMILDALAGLGNLLVDTGRNLIQGLIRGIESAIGWLKEKLSWVTDMLPDWKGPMRVDARLLEPTGRVIMQGLVTGIDVGAGDVEKRLGAVTAAVAATPAPAPAAARQTDQAAALQTALTRAVREGLAGAELGLARRSGRVVAQLTNDVNRSDARRGR
ncbi:Phage-related protein [Saccharopolyspora kobensis]|uniref:Phage-related protein n=1 Tax=Saccharopolyspora kobensis TaxID=146035 RepID=A0A1H6E153_9PSEU|nr:hypothetical protein [Saccharopolyspora kobensis]SEG90726.1 Phage-related protein [Saccharopolyspora kobensis]SFD93452.1 Phage-related protein [Saccharopolyspora kobensis]